jgi:prevent-host-death family protein
MEITSTEAQNNFGRYMKFAMYEDIIVTKNGRKTLVIGRYDKIKETDAVNEKTEAYQADLTEISYEEFLMLSKDSSERYEYINGHVYLLASPSFDHQSIIAVVLNTLFNWFGGKKCRPLTAPFDVTLTNILHNDSKNVVQPDVLVICDTGKISEKGRYTGVPSLVVEVLSPTTRSIDMLEKLDLYSGSGIKEYWIMDPVNTQAYLYVFTDHKIAEYYAFRKNETIKSRFFEGLEVSLEQTFAVI